MPYPFLTGVSIVESSAFVPAPLAGMALAQFGADVIRVDAIGGGIDYRRAPCVNENGRSLFWASLNAGKRSLAIDFRKPEARELLQELVIQTGNLLTNRAVSWLSHANLSVRRKDLISCSIEGNPDGSSAMECTIQSATGIPMLARKSLEDGPTNSPFPAWDVITAYQAAFSFMGAINRRLVSGEGSEIKLAMSDVAFSTISHLGLLPEAEISGRDRPPAGNDVYGAFGRDFRTADGTFVMVVAITLPQWQALVACCQAQDAINLAQHRCGFDFSDELQRYEGREIIAQILAPWFRSREFSEVEGALNAYKVSWGKYATVKQLLDEDRRVGTQNPMFERRVTPGVGEHLGARFAARFENCERTASTGAALLGTHTDEVLQTVLGLSSIEIARLHDARIIAGPESDPTVCR